MRYLLFAVVWLVFGGLLTILASALGGIGPIEFAVIMVLAGVLAWLAVLRRSVRGNRP